MFDIRIKEHRKTLFNEENEKEKKNNRTMLFDAF